jgi:hypothetical protein
MLMMRRFWSEHKHRTGKHRESVRFDSRPNGPNAFRWEDRLLVLLLPVLILGYLLLVSYIFVLLSSLLHQSGSAADCRSCHRSIDCCSVRGHLFLALAPQSGVHNPAISAQKQPCNART